MTNSSAQIFLGNDWLRLFKKAGVVWEYPGHGPHAAYEMTPKHAGFYFHSGLAAADPLLVRDAARAFADICVAGNIRPDRIVSYVAGIAAGQVFADEMAKIMSVPSGAISLKDAACQFQPRKGGTVLIVTDDIYSGGSLDKTIGLIKAAGGKILSPIFTLGNFYGATSFQGHEVVSLFKRKIDMWDAENCPLCKKGSPAVKARQQWQELTKQ